MQNKCVLVTGGARRLGAAIVRRLHAVGANVMVHYRASAAEARALVKALNTVRTGSAAAVKADLLHADTPRALVASCINTFGRLDVLVNNASSFYPTPVGRMNERVWNDLIGSNLKAPLFLAQAAEAELKKRRGAIVNIVDIHAEIPLKDYVIYTVAKGGLAALTRSLARELAPRVRVNGVSPGPILWPDANIWKNPKTRAAIIKRSALQRVGEPNDIARAVAFLVTDAPYVTGQIIAVDGGRSISL
ncbi:MAG: pteridine reductase [Betaproteobacteria bacterium]|nr:pteridine reductase [Betaproteobacteria bacterium]